MPHDDTDPHPSGPSRWLGRACSFDYASDGTPGSPSRRLCGVVETARYIGRTVRGQIPDTALVVRGKSGTALTISLVESKASFSE